MLLVLVGGQQGVDQLDEADDREEKGAHADGADVLASVPLGCFGVGAFTFEVPAGGGACDQEVAGMNEEEDDPEEVEDVHSSEDVD